MQQLKKFFKTTRRSSLTNIKPLTDGISIDDLPCDIMEEIFLRVPAKDLCKSAVLVSKHWHDLIESEMFWIEKSLFDKLLNREVINILQERGELNLAKRLYFSGFFNRNLLKNPCGFDQFNHWNKVKNLNDFKNTILSYLNSQNKLTSLNGFEIENPPGNGMNDQVITSDNKPCKSFVTSYRLGEKYQVIELDEDLISRIKPKIEISENYGARFDCGSRYTLKVFLVDSEFKKRDKYVFEDTMPQWCDAKWKEVKHTFNVDYPVKYVLFYHSGVDTQFWAGNFGSKMTNGSVKVIFS